MNVPEKDRFFWTSFQTYLHNIDNPFSITPKTDKRGYRSYATVNKRTADSNLCLGIDFCVMKEIIRISLSFRGEYVRLFDELEAYHGDDIRKMLDGDTYGDILCGVLKVDTARHLGIKKSVPAKDVGSYDEIIRDAVPVVLKCMEVCRRFVPGALDY